MNKYGELLNKKNIYITETSSPNIREAYMNQFKNDFTTFLRMRSYEVVNKGHMVLTIRCKNDEDDGYDICEFLGNTLHDMVSMVRLPICFIYVFLFFHYILMFFFFLIIIDFRE